MKVYDTIIIGGGPAGVICGIHLEGNNLLLEKNDALLKKMTITGGGRCNLTNNATLEEYMQSYYGNGKYYRNAFCNFFNKDIINLLEENDCKTKVEENKRVFPVTDKSTSVTKTLIKLLEKSDTKFSINSRVTSIKKEDNLFNICINGKTIVKSKNLVLACGGNCYVPDNTGNDGYALAKSLGHHSSQQMGGLSPVTVKEKWTKKLQGITVNVKIEIKADKKRLNTSRGSIIFTHDGLSGFPILDNSMQIEKHLRKNQNVIINLDLCEKYSYDELDLYLRETFDKNTNKKVKTCISTLVAKKISKVLLEQLKIDPEKIANQVTRKERIKIRDLLKRLTFTVDKVKQEDSMVTNSGIKRKEINPNTFESKITDDLYIIGELIEGCGICGGFNLQQAYSTGYTVSKTINEEKNK